MKQGLDNRIGRAVQCQVHRRHALVIIAQPFMA